MGRLRREAEVTTERVSSSRGRAGHRSPKRSLPQARAPAIRATHSTETSRPARGRIPLRRPANRWSRLPTPEPLDQTGTPHYWLAKQEVGRILEAAAAGNAFEVGHAAAHRGRHGEVCPGAAMICSSRPWLTTTARLRSLASPRQHGRLRGQDRTRGRLQDRGVVVARSGGLPARRRHGDRAKAYPR